MILTRAIDLFDPATCLIILFLTLTIQLNAQPAGPVDILIKGGHVIDPKNGINEVMDVAVAGGKITKVAKDIKEDARRVVNAQGMYVTPGLIDMHVHVFHGMQPNRYIADSYGSLPPDGFTFSNGVTTVVDAGSAGWRNFEKFKAQTIDRAQTRVLAFLNISSRGMSGDPFEQDTSEMSAKLTSIVARANRRDIVGIKLAHFTGPDWLPANRAIEAAGMAGIPLMVDFGGSTPKLSIEELLLRRMRPGDILTHTFSSIPTRESLVDDNLHVKPFVFDAQRRGIIFDVGHGAGAFVWSQAIPSVTQGFKPNTMGTDLYAPSVNAGLKSLPNLMSKFLNMGMTLREVIEASTWTPAKVINRPALGHLSAGSEADIAIFSMLEGNFGFTDVRGVRMDGTKKLQAELTIRNGRVVWDLNGISARAWDGKPQ